MPTGRPTGAISEVSFIQLPPSNGPPGIVVDEYVLEYSPIFISRQPTES